MGTISLDGSKMKANASKHKALSYKHACKLEKQLKAEVDELLKMAEKANTEELPEELSIPDELMRREDRLAVIAKAKAEIERRAQERYQQELEEYKEKLARLEAIRVTWKKAQSQCNPEASESVPGDEDPVQLTDPESRSMT